MTLEERIAALEERQKNYERDVKIAAMIYAVSAGICLLIVVIGILLK